VKQLLEQTPPGVYCTTKEHRYIRPYAYYLSKNSLAECNYEIHDKELLAFIHCLRCRNQSSAVYIDSQLCQTTGIYDTSLGCTELTGEAASSEIQPPIVCWEVHISVLAYKVANSAARRITLGLDTRESSARSGVMTEPQQHMVGAWDLKQQMILWVATVLDPAPNRGPCACLSIPTLGVCSSCWRHPTNAGQLRCVFALPPRFPNLLYIKN
jgi:hypothetical protein